MITISDVTTEFERLKFKGRSFSSLARGIKCPVKEVREIVDTNPDIFIKDGIFYARVVCLE